jgi:uncharacterized protein YggE
MEERLFQMVIICLLVGALFVSLLFSGSSSDPQIIAVSGNGVVSGSPDIVSVQIGISSSSPDPKTAVADISRRTQLVINSIKNSSVAIIETSEYQIYRQEKESETWYEASNWISATSPNLDELGLIIDSGVRAGANEVRSIRYEFSDGKKTQVREGAIEKAIEDAKRQADISLKGVGKSRGDVIRITISDSGFLYQEKYQALAGDAVATPIIPQEQKISVNALCEFEIL